MPITGHNAINAALAADRAAAAAFFTGLETALTTTRRVLPSHDLTGVNFRRHAVAVANAELAHSRDDWARIVAEHHAGAFHDSPRQGEPHPSERYRLPHEHIAARIANINGHLIAARGSWDAAKRYRPVDAAYLRSLIAHRRGLWRLFLDAVSRYRAARAKLDAPVLAMAAE